MLEKFIEGEGPPKLMFCYQIVESQSSDEMKDNIEASLFLTYGDSEKLKEKAVWFLRMTPEHRKNVNLQE
jgi:dynein heavy chain